MSLLRVKKDAENFILLHPVDQKFSCEALVLEDCIVLDYLVKVFNTLDPTFEKTGFEAHEGNFKLEHLSLLFSLFFRSDSSLEKVY